MMIRFPIQDCHRTIDLLDKEEANHLVGEGHLAERQLLVRDFIESFAEPVWSTDDEHQPT